MVIPSLPKRPILGNLHEWRTDRLALLHAASTCGSLGAFHIGSWPIILVNDLNLIEQILVTESADVEKSPMLRRHLRPLLGDGLVTSTNATNRRHKRVIASAFQPAALARMLEPIVAQTHTAIDAWRDGQSINLDKAFTDLTLAIMGHILFGNPIAYSTDPALQWSLTELNRYANLKTTDLIDPPLWLPLPRHRRLKKALAILDTRIYHLIEQHKAGSSNTHTHLLGLLLAARNDDGTGLTAVEVRDELATFFLAGHETTAVALQWLFMMLHHHPDLTQRLRSELDSVLHGRSVQLADLERLPLLRATVHEVLRLYPPVYVLARSAQRPMNLGGYEIPNETSLAISPYTVHRRADIYPEPERFHPDRWLTDPAPPRFGFIPFGDGPRSCIGKHVAMMELMLITATIVQRVAIQVGAIPKPEPMVTLRPQGPLHGVVQKRAQSVAVG